jgi:hypothetical protein
LWSPGIRLTHRGIYDPLLPGSLSEGCSEGTFILTAPFA